jgi:hypothetical protein
MKHVRHPNLQTIDLQQAMWAPFKYPHTLGKVITVNNTTKSSNRCYLKLKDGGITKQHVSAYRWPSSCFISKLCSKNIIQSLQSRIGVEISSPMCSEIFRFILLAWNLLLSRAVYEYHSGGVWPWGGCGVWIALVVWVYLRHLVGRPLFSGVSIILLQHSLRWNLMMASNGPKHVVS